MHEHRDSSKPRLGSRAKKVKSGCSTCKVRKIKCDEARPACRRCTSTGRTCAGYGIWSQETGGGDPPHEVSFFAVPTRSIQICKVSDEEHFYLDWFRCRTIAKLPGVFACGYWKTLIYQASVDEPAVRHAVVALSAAHKSEIVSGDCLGSSSTGPNEQERQMLLHYNVAIASLTHGIGKLSNAHTSVALTVCVLFVCLEQLRGHYQTAQKHLQAGAALLASARLLSSLTDKRSSSRTNHHDSIDDDVANALRSLQSRAVLLFPAGQRIDSSSYTEVAIPSTFQSIFQAKHILDHLLRKAYILVEQYFQFDTDVPCELLRAQQDLARELVDWSCTYKAFKADRETGIAIYGEVRNHLLISHHAMASIMIATCRDNITTSTSILTDFIRIIAHSIPLARIRRRPGFDTLHQKLYGTIPEKTTHGIDIGWIPPLYYTALKCHVARIRVHAIRLLERSPHREGPWAAPIAVAIAKQVAELEYDRPFEEFCVDVGETPWDNVPVEEGYACLPNIEKRLFIQQVEVFLPDDALGNVLIRCSWRTQSGERNTIGRVYDVLTSSWSDEVHSRSVS